MRRIVIKKLKKRNSQTKKKKTKVTVKTTTPIEINIFLLLEDIYNRRRIRHTPFTTA
jgi:hypothetical protein